VLEPLIAAAGLKDHARLAIVHASEVITMEDKPLRAIARKKDSSMVRGFNLVKEGQAAAFVSSGNTGALMAGSKLLVGSIGGVDRAGAGRRHPAGKRHFILIDAGANPEATAEHLVHNAILGADYARVIFGIAAPRVGLLTIGTEEGKGTALTTEANNLLKKINGIINYSGPIEGFQVFRDHVDVVVCDGFVGNTLLKTWESLAKFISGMLRDEIKRTPGAPAGWRPRQGGLRRAEIPDEPRCLRRRPPARRARQHPQSPRVLQSPCLGQRHPVAAKVIHHDLYHRIETDIAGANTRMTAPLTTPPVAS
jgi:glycerol-3-phosphate acyltransferase PlsX